ncbi:MAG: uncharacterized protein QOE08_1467 [Thermoleophilaceae bacterium]|nr:uncharacterized protein [Thermoleophilaceae bacterium]
MHVAELWRYPVKGLRGEQLTEVEVLPDGLFGDRACQVRTDNGNLHTARTKPALLGLAALTDHDGMPLVEGARWDSGHAAAAVRGAAGDEAVLRPSSSKRFDETPLLVATDGGIEALGIDGRRLRPNIVVGGVEGLSERDWVGRTLRAGEVEIEVLHVCERCVVTTFDPDTIEQDAGVLRMINDDFGGLAALNCNVARPGRIAVGDPVELV